VPAVQDDRPETVGTPLFALTATRRPTERLFSPVQWRRPLGFGAVMSRILTVREFDRKPNAPQLGFYLISKRRQACFLSDHVRLPRKRSAARRSGAAPARRRR
jgi:hypothetical protein